MLENDLKDEPYIDISRRDGGFHATGQLQHSAGHKLDGSDGQSDGIFFEWRWDGAGLSAITCRSGALPLYYFVQPDRVCLSPSLPKLIELGAPVELDRDALAIFLRLGYFLAEDTPFAAIKTLPPDGRLAWNGTLRLSGGIRLASPVPLSRDRAIDEFIFRFRRAIERRSHTRCIVPLSGGRDSRHILFELCRLGRPEVCITAKNVPPWPNPSDDELCARKVTNELGVRHIVIDYVEDFVESERRKNLATGFCVFDHAWYLAILDRLESHAAPTMDGVAGDYLSAGGGTDRKSDELFREGRLVELADHAITRRALRELNYLRHPEEFSFAMAKRRLNQELERHVDAPSRLGSYLYWNRVRRGLCLIPYGIMRHRLVYAPYLDHDVVDLLMGLPSEMFLDRTFHTEAIQRAFPQFAHLPFEARRRKPRARPHAYYRRNTFELLRLALRCRSKRMNTAFVAPRLLADLTIGDERSWWISRPLIYLDQLEELIAAARHKRAGR